MKLFTRLLILLVFLVFSTNAVARLEVCNSTDLVLMVSVGYDTTEERTVSEGWWRIYPGFCEVPVDVTFLKGSYYVHAESNPSSTMPGDAYTWGEEKPLCVELQSEFRLPDANFCTSENTIINFNEINKTWSNQTSVNLTHEQRQYRHEFATKVAGVQRLLAVLGYDIGDIDGTIGEKTLTALNEIGVSNTVFGFDFKIIYPLLEKLIVEKNKLSY